MTTKPRRRPATLTVFGIYSRHLSRGLELEADAVNAHIDLMPLDGELLVVGLDPALGEGIRDPERWKAWDAAASSELGQPLVTELNLDQSLAHIRQAPATT